MFGLGAGRAQAAQTEAMCIAKADSGIAGQPGILLSVNGTLMRGLKLERPNMIGTHSTFVADVLTAPSYDLYAVNDDHPMMLRKAEEGRSVAGEAWCVPFASVAVILAREPAGLAIGKVDLLKPLVVRAPDGTQHSWKTVLGVIGEEVVLKDAKTTPIGERYDGSFRAYVSETGMKLVDSFLRDHPNVAPAIRDQALLDRKRGASLHQEGVAELLSDPPNPSAAAASFMKSIDAFHHAIVLLGIHHSLYPLPLNADGTCSERNCMPFLEPKA